MFCCDVFYSQIVSWAGQNGKPGGKCCFSLCIVHSTGRLLKLIDWLLRGTFDSFSLWSILKAVFLATWKGCKGDTVDCKHSRLPAYLSMGSWRTLEMYSLGKTWYVQMLMHLLVVFSCLNLCQNMRIPPGQCSLLLFISLSLSV